MKKSLKRFFTRDHEKKLKEFEALALPLMDRLYATALRMTKNQSDAEDLVQATYLKAWRFYHGFKPGTNIEGWIFRILANNFINEYRRKKREPVRVDFETTQATYREESLGEVEADRISEFDENYKELFDDTISNALNNLPAKYRLVVLLSDVNNLKYKEIAQVLDCPIGTVMSRLSRGRQMLAQNLRPYARENGYLSTQPAEQNDESRV
ncbi:MAG: sigma-70 family RNA polymerase sigma factor [bacterium]